ncbi:MAG: GDP-mannose 4,6-dehydratase [Thermoanaerobaculia bacterium]
MAHRVLVTGATGFVGRRLVAQLVRSGHAVGGVAIDGAAQMTGVEWFAVDVRDAGALVRVVDAFSPDRIVHLAALSHVGESWRRIPDYYAINVEGAGNLFSAARGRATIFMSSAEVYGLVPDHEQPIREIRALAPRTPYALTKAAAERMALAAGATVVRSFNLIGPGQATNFALPDFAAQLAAIERGERPAELAVGNLSARRDFVHVDDAVDALVRLVTRPQPGEIFNLASGEDRSISELLDKMVELAGIEVRRVEDPTRLRPVDVARLCGDASRLRNLGWEPRRGVERGLADVLAAARESA